MNRQLPFLAVIILSVLSISAMAHGYKIGEIEIAHPHTRPTPPGAPVSGGYMTIRNTGAEDDRLLGGSATFAEKVEIHEMTMEGDIMKMRPVAGGLVIPAGGEVTLEPGGLHVMFMGLGEQIEEGMKYKATLQFERAGTIEIEFSADRPNKEKSAKEDHSGHSMEESN